MNFVSQSKTLSRHDASRRLGVELPWNEKDWSEFGLLVNTFHMFSQSRVVRKTVNLMLLKPVP